MNNVMRIHCIAKQISQRITYIKSYLETIECFDLMKEQTVKWVSMQEAVHSV